MTSFFELPCIFRKKIAGFFFRSSLNCVIAGSVRAQVADEFGVFSRDAGLVEVINKLMCEFYL